MSDPRTKRWGITGAEWERIVSRKCLVCGHRADEHDIEPPYYCPVGTDMFTESAPPHSTWKTTDE